MCGESILVPFTEIQPGDVILDADFTTPTVTAVGVCHPVPESLHLFGGMGWIAVALPTDPHHTYELHDFLDAGRWVRRCQCHPFR